MNAKYCKWCNNNKLEIDFYKLKNKCKDCISTYNKKYSKVYREQNKDEIKKSKQEYEKNNREYINAKKREMKSKNRQKYRDKYKEYYYNMSDDMKKIYYEKKKIYKSNNKDKLNKKRRINRKKRYCIDLIYKLKINFSSQIRSKLKNNKNKKSILNYLPYTIDKLRTHLESLFEPWMNWQNHGKYSLDTWNDNDPTTWKWQIDHIIPHSHFNYTSMEDEEFKKCWALNNLRPYSAKQNVIDGNRRL